MTSYFDGLEFVTWGNVPRSDEIQKDRYFNGYYGIQFTWRGKLEYAVDDMPHQIVSEYPVLFTRPLRKFYYSAPAGEYRHHVFVCFRGPRVDEWLESGLFPTADLMQLTRPEPFYASLQQLLERLNLPGANRQPRTVLLLEELLLQLHEQPRGVHIAVALQQGLESLAARICHHPERDWDWDREAHKLFISTVHFRRVFKQLTGLAPLQFQLECRLQLAASLLLQNGMSVGEAARRSGFSDVFYFSRLFKKHRKLTPFAYHRAFAASITK